MLAPIDAATMASGIAAISSSLRFADWIATTTVNPAKPQ
jgi:hypothetical protein